jgi:hypothetical protein
MTKVEELQHDEIPDPLKEEIVHRLSDFTVAFLRLDVEDRTHGGDAALLGSGILVAIGSTFGILTAHHVIQELPRTGRLGLFLAPTSEPHSVDVNGLTYLIARGTEDHVGPDLGAVILAPSIAGTIAAKKSFYNLELRRERLLTDPPDPREGLWFCQGFPAENTSVQPDPILGYGFVKYFYSLGAIGRPQSVEQIGEHDYLTIPVSPSASPPIPNRFGGMSGCGIWQVPLVREKSGAIRYQTFLLSGVAFYQGFTNATVSSLRCHGRASLYGMAYDAIASTSPNETLQPTSGA